MEALYKTETEYTYELYENFRRGFKKRVLPPFLCIFFICCITEFWGDFRTSEQ